MARTVDAKDMRDILGGATYLGAGGGGPIAAGMKMVEILEASGRAQATLADVDEMKDSEWAITLCGIGRPSAVLDLPDWPEGAVALRATQKLLAAQGQDIGYLMPVEPGGLNTMIPFYVAALEGLPVVDADGAGRAVPSMSTLLQAVHGIPFDPLVMAGVNGAAIDSVVINLGDPLDGPAVENIGRHIATAYGFKAIICTAPVDKATIKDSLAPGVIEMSLRIGQALRKAKNLEELSQALELAAGARLIFRGRIEAIELTEGTHDVGKTVVRGLTGAPNDWVSIHYMNENILMRDSAGKVIGSVPDLICLVNADTMAPLSNAETAQGQNVAVFGQKAHANWYRTPAGLDCWRPIFDLLNYDGGYVPLF